MNTEHISQMILITLLGILIVFSVLIVIWAVIEIMHIIVSKIESKANGGKDTEKKSVAAEAPAPVQKAVAEAENDDEIAAVIAAAIAAFTSGENSSSTYNLRIKSFRRISTSRSAWNSESRGGYEII